MSQIRCAVIAATQHAHWLAEWSGQDFSPQGIAVNPESPGAPGPLSGAPAVADTPVDALLMLVARDGLVWARKKLAQVRPDEPPVIVVTRGVPASNIRELLQLGARDFLACNCAKEELKLRLWRLISSRASPRSQGASAAHPLLQQFIGANPVFLRQVQRVPVVADCDAGVLISGETGTGKELFAQAVHYLSSRAANPLVAINCAALPAELVEAELFGHLRGAYTSAHQAQAGLISQAENGTLFLDEVDNLPHAAQAKLLRFLQDKEFRVVGASETQHANVRVIAASNADLAELAEQGRFRRDLFYRLNILNLKLPPLRERMEDLLPLAEHFRARFLREHKRRPVILSRAAVERMMAHDWPGNVRELEHAMARAVLMCTGDAIGPEELDLPQAGCPAPGTESFQSAKARAVKDFERLYIERMLLLHRGNISRAAEASAKNRRAFWQLIRKHRIDASRYRASGGP
jgi:two-component system response regulator GlrR